MKTIVKESYTADFTTTVQTASDGKSYWQRFRNKTPWGYSWSKWRQCNQVCFDSLEDWRIKSCNVRLPKS